MRTMLSRSALACQALTSAAALGLALGSASATAGDETPLYRDRSASIERRVADLLGRMTTEEKIAQLRSLSRRSAVTDASGAFSPELAAPVLKNGTGYLGRLTMYAKPRDGALITNATQRYLIEHTRLGIPALFTDEALHGYMASGATAFPQAIGLASTWDPSLVERVFGAAAREMRARGANWALSPVLDLGREPRWGRTEETYGEDPYLVSQIGVAAIRGLQGRSATIDKAHVLATAKHFAAHGQPEGGTNTAPANFSERILREQFLKPFEAAVRQAGVGSVMASYNEIDGIPVHVNRWVLGTVLRGDWAFRGFVCSDGGGITDLVTRHHVARDAADAAAQAFESGVDLELDGTFGTLSEQLQSGRLPMARLDEAVGRVLAAKFALGLFDDPYTDVEAAAGVTNSEEHRALALEAARKAIVLLRNDGGLLPLDRQRRQTLAVIGPNAADVHTGGYSYDPAPGVSALEGIRRKVGNDARVLYAEGVRITTGAQGWKAWWDDAAELPPPADDAARIEEAVRVAKKADVVVLVLGENEAVCREAWAEVHLGDRDNLDLPGRQNDLVAAILAAGKPTVVVLFNGRPLSIVGIAERVPAILEGWYLGQETGTALADVLFGDVNPSGRLPITVPRSVGQLPAYYYQKPTAKRGFLFTSSEPLFPFGHGLSYTSFRYDKLSVTPAEIRPDQQTTVSVEITNTGKRAGDEVVQLYLRDQVSSVTRPVKELKGFERVTLAAGETRTVRFTLGPAELSLLDREMRRVVEPGRFDVIVGGSSTALASAALVVVP